MVVSSRFRSKNLTRSQKTWSDFDKKMLACYLSFKLFRFFLDGTNSFLPIDHRSIVTSFKRLTRGSSPRQESVFELIIQMTSSVEHTGGNINVVDFFHLLNQPNVNATLPCFYLLITCKSLVIE